MNSYELVFEIDGQVSDLQQERILTELEATFNHTHEHATLVMGNFEGEDCVDAAQMARHELQRRGVSVLRLQEDLVTRSEMAFRLGVTRQTATNWASGTRRSGFPLPNRETAQGLWLWGDVVAWMQTQPGGYKTYETAWPTQEDHDLVNGWLARARHADQRAEPPFVRHQLA